VADAPGLSEQPASLDGMIRATDRHVGADYRGCLVVTVLRSQDLYRLVEGLWRGMAETR
jgi:hypothetical protein